MPLNDIWSVKLVCRHTDQLGVNVIHYAVSGEQGTGASPQQVAVAADNKFAVVYKPLLANTAEWRGVIAGKIFPLPPSLTGLSNGNAGLGTAVGIIQPSQVSGIITKLTGFAGRTYRGRVYVPFPVQSDSLTDGRHTTVGYQDRLKAIGDQLLVPISAGAGGNTTTLIAVILHRANMSFTPVTLYNARGLWATQRRRGAYGRTNAVPI